MNFTRQNLVRVLEQSGLTVLQSGADRFPLPDEVKGMVPHTPRFYVIVEADNDDMIAFLRVVSEVVWAEFTRGEMEFEGHLYEGRARMWITRNPDPEVQGHHEPT